MFVFELSFFDVDSLQNSTIPQLPESCIEKPTYKQNAKVSDTEYNLLRNSSIYEKIVRPCNNKNQEH